MPQACQKALGGKRVWVGAGGRLTGRPVELIDGRAVRRKRLDTGVGCDVFLRLSLEVQSSVSRQDVPNDGGASTSYFIAHPLRHLAGGDVGKLDDGYHLLASEHENQKYGCAES
jgi:hypothetical protein